MSRYAIRGTRLIDGRTAEPLADAVMLICDGKITEIHQGDAPVEWLSTDLQFFDFPTGTIMPGLINCHVHLNLPGDGTPLPDAAQAGEGELIAASIKNSRDAVRSGVTTIRDCGGRGRIAMDLRKVFGLGYGEGPRILTCGQPITPKRGHCWYFGGEVEGEPALRAKVRQLSGQGFDFVKVMGSGGGTPGTKPWLPSYTREEIRALVEESHAVGLKIGVHCSCADAIRYAAEARADQIEHANFVTEGGTQRWCDEAAFLLAESGAAVCPTLSVAHHVIRAMQDGQGENQHPLDVWKTSLDTNLSYFSRMLRLGVRFVAGSDAGWRNTGFGDFKDELALMQAGGMSSIDVIRSATGEAARALGIDSVTGSLKKDLAADVLVVEGNPLQDLEALARPLCIMKAGRVLFRS